MTALPSPLYRIAVVADWAAARETGAVPWGVVDRRDGFLHLSTGPQVLDTARLYLAGRKELLALEIDASMLEGEIRFEPSRGGALFPHLYGALSVAAVTRVRPLVPTLDGFAFEDAA